MTIPRLTVPFADWLANAAPGDRVIVQTAAHNSAIVVSEARDAGLITTCQKRASPNTFHLIATRLKNGKADTAPIGRGQVGSLYKPQKAKGPRPETVQKMRRAVELKAQGMTVQRVADKMGITREAAKHCLRRAREEGMSE